VDCDPVRRAVIGLLRDECLNANWYAASERHRVGDADVVEHLCNQVP
jgi:hypothetical protein